MKRNVKLCKVINAITAIILIVTFSIMPITGNLIYATDEPSGELNEPGDEQADASSDQRETPSDDLDPLLDLFDAEIELKPGCEGIILPAFQPGSDAMDITSEFLDQFLQVRLDGNILPLEVVEDVGRNYDFQVIKHIGGSQEDNAIYTLDALEIRVYTYNHIYDAEQYSESETFTFDAYTSLTKMTGDYKLVVEEIEDQYHTGESITPQLDVYYIDDFLDSHIKLGESLKQGTDYRVEYEDNKDVGQAIVTIVGIGKYRGIKEVKFNILPHNHDELTHVPAKEATCAEDGNKEYWTCEICGKVFSDSKGTTESGPSAFKVSAIGHSYDGWEYYNIHHHARICSRDKSHIELEGHKWDDGTITIDPTPNRKGQKTYSCIVCKATKVEDIENVLPATAARLYGNNRYETASRIANQIKSLVSEDRFDKLIIATGTGYPDALTGAYLAKVKNAPIVLYKEGESFEYVKRNLAPQGTLYILGGTGVIPASFEAQVRSLPNRTVLRLGGANRYETNLKILQEAGNLGSEIIVATGLNFPDALSGSATGKPILLVNDKALREDQKAFLRENIFSNITVLGGPGVVNSSIAGELLKYGKVTRIYGENRYETSAKIAKKYFKTTGQVILAVGTNFPDALTGTPLAFHLRAPMLLAGSKGRECQYAIEYVNSAQATRCVVLGGPALISDGAVNAIIG